MNANIDKCWAEKYCKGYPEKCNKFCDGYVILEILYSQSNIPKRYQYPQHLIVEDIDLDVFSRIEHILNNIHKWVDNGNNLLIYGENKGNGKTSLACAIANYYIRYRAKNLVTYEPVVYFIKSAKFLEDLRRQYDNPDPAFPKIMELIETVPLLIIDDIGAEKPSDWVRERLLNIIDERYSNNLSIIYTSNCSLNELAVNLHGRIADRIKESEVLHMKSTSKRGANNND